MKIDKAIMPFFITIIIVISFWKILPDKFQINESSDYVGFYQPVAENILLGKGYFGKDGLFAAFYPPGYPLILASIFGISDLLHISRENILAIFLLVCIGLSSVFIFILAKNLWNTGLALFTSFLWISHPGILWLTKQPNVEIAFFPVFYGCFFTFYYSISSKQINKTLFFLCGILVGIAMLIRPIVIFLGIIFAGILWFMRNDIKKNFRLILISILILGNLIAVLPWEMQVYYNIGKIIPLSTASVPGMRDGLTFTVAQKGYRTGVSIPKDVRKLSLKMLEQNRNLNSLRSIAFFLANEFKENPFSVMKLYFLKALRSWYGTDSNRFEIFILPIQVIYLLLIGRGTYLIYKRKEEYRRFIICVWIIVFYFWFMTTLFLSILRYMLPAIGLLFIFIPGIFISDTKRSIEIWDKNK